MGPVRIRTIWFFNPIQWYFGRIHWDNVERLELGRVGRKAIPSILAVRQGINVRIMLTAVRDPVGLVDAMRTMAPDTVEVAPNLESYVHHNT